MGVCVLSVEGIHYTDRNGRLPFQPITCVKKVTSSLLVTMVEAPLQKR